MDPERFFERLAAETADDGADAERAPARLKSRVYSAIVSAQAARRPLRSLATTRDTGGALCVFEHVVAAAPIGDALKAKNPCRVCHARVLGERLDHAPIYWPNCPVFGVPPVVRPLSAVVPAAQNSTRTPTRFWKFMSTRSPGGVRRSLMGLGLIPSLNE